MKRGAAMRVLAVLLGVGLGATLCFQMMQQNPKWRDQADFGALAGGILGAMVIYVISGARLLLKSNMYKVRLAALNRQIRGILSKAEEHAHKELESEQPPPSATETLATAYLLQNETDKSIHNYQQARDHGRQDLESFNNAGVAMAKSGRFQNAVEMFEQAQKQSENAIAPHANLAHAYGIANVGPEAELVNRAIKESQRSLDLDGNSSERHNRQGLILCRAGRYEEALKAFNKALEIAGKDRFLQADAHNDLGIGCYAKGDVKNAMLNFQQAVKLNPGHGRALANQGVVLIQGKTVNEGLERLQKAAELDPKSASIHSNLGYALCLAKAPNEGILSLRQAIHLDPTMFEALYNIGKVYLENGITDLAGRYMARALQVHPNSWQALIAMAVINVGEEKYVEARHNMDQAIRTAPQDVDVLTVMGIVLGLTYDFDEGERYLRAALAQDKESAHVYGQLAWLHIQQQNVSLGSEELSIALGKDEKNPVLNDNYGLSQIDLASPEAGLVYFRRALQLKPNFHSVHYHIGYVLAMKKRIPEAIPEWEIAAKYENKDPNVHTNLGVAYYLKEMLEEAIGEFRRVLTLRQDRMEDYSNLALAYAKQGVALKASSKRPTDYKAKAAAEKFIQSVGMFDRAIAINSQNVVLHSNRGLACFFANRLEDALAEWSMVSRLDAEYAKKRGALQQSVFDETAINFVSMRVWERISMLPLKTPNYQFRLSAGYDTEEWDLVIGDSNLAPIPKLSREADQMERSLRALHI